MDYPISPEMFFASLFGSKAARDGAVIRRKVRDVERLVGRAAFRRELERRGYSAVENAGQFVVFCNAEAVLGFAGRATSDAEVVRKPDAVSGAS